MNQNREHLVNLCKSNILETPVIFSIQGLARTLIPVESKNEIKIKIIQL